MKETRETRKADLARFKISEEKKEEQYREDLARQKKEIEANKARYKKEHEDFMNHSSINIEEITAQW